MSLLFQAYPLVRPILFALDPEVAHRLTLASLQRAYQCKMTQPLIHSSAQFPIKLMGLNLANPVGLAAGMDKNGAYIDALANLGFGFLEIGTVTPRPQFGQAKPRMFRLPQAQALINRLGFNNQGLETFIANVKRSQWRQQGGVLGLNIGKNADTPIEEAGSDYVIGLKGVYAHADYITVNISSPNTQNLRSLQNEDELVKLLALLQEERKKLTDQYERKVPLVVKVAPDLTMEQIDVLADILPRYNIEGIVATNTTISRQGVQHLNHAEQQGGLSGLPLHEQSLNVISRLKQKLGSALALIGVGGILSGKQAQEKIAAGADAVQLYTGLIYRGPALISECVRELKHQVQTF